MPESERADRHAALGLALEPDRLASIRATVATAIDDPSVFERADETTTRRHGQRVWWTLGAVAASIAAVVGVALVIGNDQSSVVITPGTTDPVASTTPQPPPSTSIAPTTIDATEVTSSTPTTELATDAALPDPQDEAAPTAFAAASYASVELPTDRLDPVFSGDGRFVVLGPGPVVDVIDAATATIVEVGLACPAPGSPLDPRWTIELLEAVRSPWYCGVDVGVDGDGLLIARGNTRGTLEPPALTTVWDAATGDVLAVLAGRSMGFGPTPDGSSTQLLAWDGETSKAWKRGDPTEGVPVDGPVAQFLPDGRLVTTDEFGGEFVSFSGDGRFGVNESGIYDLSDFSRIADTPASMFGAILRISREGALAFHSGLAIDGWRGVVDTRSGQQLFEAPEYRVVGAFSPVADVFATTQGGSGPPGPGPGESQAPYSLTFWSYSRESSPAHLPAVGTTVAGTEFAAVLTASIVIDPMRTNVGVVSFSSDGSTIVVPHLGEGGYDVYDGLTLDLLASCQAESSPQAELPGACRLDEIPSERSSPHVTPDGLHFVNGVEVPSGQLQGVYRDDRAVFIGFPGYLVVGDMSPAGGRFVVVSDSASTDRETIYSLQLWEYSVSRTDPEG